jgi:pimeloyl-ACP methyl ester carboxylesterase
MNKGRILKISFPLIVFLGLYFIGPQPEKPVYSDSIPNVPLEPEALETYVHDNERAHKIKPDNEARIIWADSSKAKTKYVIVYLHGFSASQKEGEPVHLRFAKEFGCNLYLSRLADHGIDTVETLLYFTADRFWSSAKQALAIGNALGEKVILVSTSTGSTAALMLAARYPDRVHALINLSPNIAINDPAAFLLNDPWGLQIARTVLGGKYRITKNDTMPVHGQYWNGRYRIEALVQLEELIETTMNKETFEKVTQPSLTLYYYKNEEEQDPEVKVSAMLNMHRQLGTPDSLKVAKAVPGAGAHVIGGALASKDIESVYNAMTAFAHEQLQLTGSSMAIR